MAADRYFNPWNGLRDIGSVAQTDQPIAGHCGSLAPTAAKKRRPIRAPLLLSKNVRDAVSAR
jgi:hypothetical protein